MFYRICFLVFISLLTLAETASSTTPKKEDVGTIKVVVKGISQYTGTIRLSLDNSAVTFSGDVNPDFRVGEVSADAPQVSCEFNLVPYGSYAIKLFHDANANSKLDTNLLGMPTESYGISNNARAMFGLPSFSQASFPHNGPITSITIDIAPHLRNFAGG